MANGTTSVMLVRCLVVAATALTAMTLHAMQLKGVRVGDPPETACDGAPLSTEIAKTLRSASAIDPTIRIRNASECETKIKDVGGFQPSEPPSLLFVDGRLAVLMIKLADLTLDDFVGLFEALKSEYGIPNTQHKGKSSSFVWGNAEQQIFLQRTRDDGGLFVVTVSLRNETAFKAFLADLDRAEAALKKLETEAKKRSLLNRD